MSSRYKDVANQQAVVEAVNPQRRLLLQRAGLLSVASFVPSALRTAWAHGDDRPDSLFTLGVASGDPSSHGVVLWTRPAAQQRGHGRSLLAERACDIPFIVTADDHEVDHNYAGLIPKDDQTAQAVANLRGGVRV